MTGQVQNTSVDIRRKTTVNFEDTTDEVFIANITTGGIEAQYWIKEDGTIIRSLVQSGQMMTVAVSEEEAKTEGKFPDLVVLFKVPVKGKISSVKPGLKSLKIKFSTKDEGADLWKNSRQRQLRQDLWQLKKGDLKDLKAASSDTIADSLKIYLKPTIFIQSGNKEITAKTGEIVSDQDDVMTRVGKLNAWVHGWIKKKDYGMGFGSALEALEKRRGDCTEHAMLLAALCKASGIPARVALGLVATGTGTFEYHMWTQVYAGEWIDADPGLNQFPVDASHIMFFTGRMEEKNLFPISQLMFKILGKAEIEVIEAD
jgi:hypothetical protein